MFFNMLSIEKRILKKKYFDKSQKNNSLFYNFAKIVRNEYQKIS